MKLRLRKMAVVLLCLAAAAPLHAGRRRAAVPVETTLSISFVDPPGADSTLTTNAAEAWLDVKTVAQPPVTREPGIRIRRQFGIRVERAGAVAWGTATVTARLESWDRRAMVRIDGRQLTTAPLVVNRRAEVGAVTFHTLEIEIPPSVPEGPLTASINWEVTAE